MVMDCEGALPSPLSFMDGAGDGKKGSWRSAVYGQGSVSARPVPASLGSASDPESRRLARSGHSQRGPDKVVDPVLPVSPRRLHGA